MRDRRRRRAQHERLLLSLFVAMLNASPHSARAWTGEVTLKLAVDLNGGVDDRAGAKSERFTSGFALDAVHRLRRASDAVLVGVATVVRDDPSLTVRRVSADRQPLRVVVDPTLRTPRDSKLLTDRAAPTVLFATTQPREHDDDDAIAVEPFASLEALLDTLETRYAVRRLMVEGGPATARGFLDAGLVDRAILVRAPVAFADPVPLGFDAARLRAAGLRFAGHRRWDGLDDAMMWLRPGADANWATLEGIDEASGS